MINLVHSREIIEKTSSESPNENEADYDRNAIERDYYSDFDDEYERKTETIRTAENWISLFVLAFSLIVSILIVIILVHLKSRKESQLMSLM